MELTNEEKEYLADRDKKVHKVKLISKDPFCASVPSDMLSECDTWILKPMQKTCKKGHKIEYMEWKPNDRTREA